LTLTLPYQAPDLEILDIQSDGYADICECQVQPKLQ